MAVFSVTCPGCGARKVSIDDRGSCPGCGAFLVVRLGAPERPPAGTAIYKRDASGSWRLAARA